MSQGKTEEQVKADETAAAEAAAKAQADQAAAEAAAKAKADADAAAAAAAKQDDFDPSKIDINDPDVVGSLTDEQFQKVQEFQGKLPVAPPEKKDDKAKDKSDQVQPAAPEVKYAGKFKDEEALVKGVEELAKKLELHNSVLQTTIDAAKQNRAFATLEAVYKGLEAEQGRRASAPPKPILEPDKTTEAQAVAPDTSEGKLFDAVTAMTYDALSKSDIAEDFAKEGIEMPKSPAEFEALKTSSPYLASEFRRMFTAVFEGNLVKAREHLAAKARLENENKSVIDSDTKALKDFAVSQGFTLTDAELAAVVEVAKSLPYAYEVKHGVKFLRKGIVQAVFMSNELPKKLAEIKQATLLAGRQQALEDIRAGREKEFTTVSTAGPGGGRGRQTSVPPIDLNDPDQIAALTDEQLEAIK